MDKLSDRMNRLLSTGVDADVHFLVGQGDEQELLPAHKPILRVASDVFDAMFRFDEEFPVLATPEHGKKTSQKEGNSPVEIPDVEVEAFTTMLSFIYTDELSGLNGHNAIDVLYAEIQFALAGQSMCEKELSNVFIAFSKARLLEEKDFAGRCLAYIDQNAADLMGSDEFFQIDQKLLCELLGRNQLVTNEEHLILFYAVLWAIKQCQQKGMECSPKNLRELLGPALYQIRFPIIQKHFLEFFAENTVMPFTLMDSSGKSLHKFNQHLAPNIWDFSSNATRTIMVGSDWSCTCSATLYVVPQNEENTHYNWGSKTIYQSFCSINGENCGFSEFMAIEKLIHPGAGWYNKAEDTVTLSAHLTTVEL